MRNKLLYLMEFTLSFLTLALSILSSADCYIVAQADNSEYCQWETFNATCPHDQVILMSSARYGRMRFGRCMREDHGSVGCSADVLSLLDRKCSGRRTCQLTIPDATLHAIHPCPKELMPYLEASYSCVKVTSGNRHACTLFGGQPLKSESGFLMGGVPPTSSQWSVGTQTCPWMIKASPGQRVNLTLFSFASIDRDSAVASVIAVVPTQMVRCSPQRLVVQERNRTVEVAVCNEKRRERHIFTSDTSEVNVFIQHNTRTTTDMDAAAGFLIKYQVIGCPDIAGHANAWVKRQGETAVIRCNFTGETFYVTCLDTEWKGELSTCSKAFPTGSGLKVEKNQTFTQGILVVIGIGVALGVSIGVIILFSVLFCLRKAKGSTSRSQLNDHLLTENRIDMEVKYGGRPYLMDTYKEYAQTIPLNNLCPFHQHLKPHYATAGPTDIDSTTVTYQPCDLESTVDGMYRSSRDYDVTSNGTHQPRDFENGSYREFPAGQYDVSPKYGKMLNNSPGSRDVVALLSPELNSGRSSSAKEHTSDKQNSSSVYETNETSFLTFKPNHVTPARSYNTRTTTPAASAASESCASLDLIKHSRSIPPALTSAENSNDPALLSDNGKNEALLTEDGPSSGLTCCGSPSDQSGSRDPALSPTETARDTELAETRLESRSFPLVSDKL